MNIMYKYIHTHTYINTYIHTYIHTCVVRCCISSNTNINIRTDMSKHVCVPIHASRIHLSYNDFKQMIVLYFCEYAPNQTYVFLDNKNK